MPEREDELRAELSSFVCDGQRGHAMQSILAAYLTHLDRDRQVAAWISGPYASGKSRLLRMFGHLWQNTEFGDGSTARDLVVGLPQEVRDQLGELDGAATTLGVPRIAAIGQLACRDGESLYESVARVICASRGVPMEGDRIGWPENEKFTHAVRKALCRDQQLPLTLIGLDDVPQQVQCSVRNTIDFINATDTLAVAFGGRMAVVGTGQVPIGTLGDGISEEWVVRHFDRWMSLSVSCLWT